MSTLSQVKEDTLSLQDGFRGLLTPPIVSYFLLSIVFLSLDPFPLTPESKGTRTDVKGYIYTYYAYLYIYAVYIYM